MNEPTLKGFQDYIEQLPLVDEPEIFGMHENANLAFMRQETGAVIGTILDLQPRAAGSSGGLSTDELVKLMAEQILEKIDIILDIEEVFLFVGNKIEFKINIFRVGRSCSIWIIKVENTR
jgi:hypothetical protein